MSAYFFDSSALVRRYKSEPGTSEVNAIFDSLGIGDRVWISMLTWVELTSAMVRAIRGLQINPEVASETLAQFESEILATPEVVPITERGVIDGVALVRRFGLRAGDAL